MQIINYHENGRVVALDVGKKRIGVAISDTNHKFCIKWFQIESNFHSLNDLFEYLASKLSEFQIAKIVIGYPYNMLSEQKQTNIQIFIEKFKNALINWINNDKLVVIWEDERLTTLEAKQYLQGSKNIKAKKDAMSAKIILEIYLNKVNI